MKLSTPEPYTPSPVVRQSIILGVGFLWFQFTSWWPSVVLLAAVIMSLVIPYCFRSNDSGEQRRKLYQRYIQSSDPMIQKVLAVPEDVDLAERYWTNSRGMALCTAVMTPKHQEAKGLVMFCHGYGDHASFMKRYNAFRFVRDGFAVATIEIEGHGRSDGPLGLIYDFDQTVTDVVEYFQEVARQFPNTKCFLMGESMGGAVAFRAYKKMPSLFNGGIVFVAPMCKISDAVKPPEWVVDMFRKVTGPIGSNGYLGFLPVAPVKQDIDDLSHRDIIMRDLCASVPFQYSRNPRLTTARELLEATSLISREMKSFDAPFLVLHGKDDRITDPKLSQALYDEAASTDKTIKLYDGMWHAITTDVPTDTDLVLNDIVQWLEKRI